MQKWLDYQANQILQDVKFFSSDIGGHVQILQPVMTGRLNLALGHKKCSCSMDMVLSIAYFSA